MRGSSSEYLDGLFEQREAQALNERVQQQTRVTEGAARVRHTQQNAAPEGLPADLLLRVVRRLQNIILLPSFSISPFL